MGNDKEEEYFDIDIITLLIILSKKNYMRVYFLKYDHYLYIFN